jgi:hypothetical protein
VVCTGGSHVSNCTTDINTEELLIQQAFVEHLEKVLGWESVYAQSYPSYAESVKYCISGKYLDRVLPMQ